MIQAKSFSISNISAYFFHTFTYFLTFSFFSVLIVFKLCEIFLKTTINILFKVYLVVTFFIYFIFLISNINTKFLIYPRTTVTSYGIFFKKPISVDTKYNCTQCAHSLNKGDYIMTNSNYGKFMKIKGLPGDLVNIDMIDKNGFFLKKSKAIDLKKGQFSAEVGNSNHHVVISKSYIIGKLD